MTFEVSLRKKSMLGSKDGEEGKKKKQNEHGHGRINKQGIVQKLKVV